MEPDQFRESRITINRICQNILKMIDAKDMEKAQTYHNEASEKLETLKSLAEGEIQKRSVKNLESKVSILSARIKKMKPASSAPKRKKSKKIVWDEERISSLSSAFLLKVLENMGLNDQATVCFGVTGKGIRPNYQILIGPENVTAYNGNSHKPLARLIDGNSTKLSRPFSKKVIENALDQDPPAA